MQNQSIQQAGRQSGDPTGNNDQKWFNSPLSFHEGTLQEIRPFIPDFEGRPFALTQPGYKRTLMNTRLDTIVRRPFGDDQSYIPVGVVSREYALVPHMAVLDRAEKAHETADIPLAEPSVSNRLTPSEIDSIKQKMRSVRAMILERNPSAQFVKP